MGSPEGGEDGSDDFVESNDERCSVCSGLAGSCSGTLVGGSGIEERGERTWSNVRI